MKSFREQDKVCALTGCIRPRLARLGEIAGYVTDGRVQLGNGDAKRIGSGLGHG